MGNKSKRDGGEERSSFVLFFDSIKTKQNEKKELSRIITIKFLFKINSLSLIYFQIIIFYLINESPRGCYNTKR